MVAWPFRHTNIDFCVDSYQVYNLKAGLHNRTSESHRGEYPQDIPWALDVHGSQTYDV